MGYTDFRTCKYYFTPLINHLINTDKTKCLITSKEQVRCKLEVDESLIEQANRFKHLGTDITSSGNLESEVREQTMKASQILSYLRDIVWRNKYLKMESESLQISRKPGNDIGC
ncbi:hypothetical protein Trydic_g14966 [Trypoxylus dichotomus]